MAEADFWNNQERAQSVVEERKSLNSILLPLDNILKTSDDLSAMIEMAAEDESFAAEVPGEVARLEAELEALKLKALLNGPHDAVGAII
jgi:peptide chain release factor 2